MAMLKHWRAIRSMPRIKKARKHRSTYGGKWNAIPIKVECYPDRSTLDDQPSVQHRQKRRYERLSVTDDA